MDPEVAIVPPTQTALEVCAQLALGEKARKLLDRQLRLTEFQALLIEKELYADAIRVTAAGLTKAHAIWWGTLCLWWLDRPEPAPQVRAVLQFVVAWLREPSDERRRGVEVAARAAGINTPAGSLGLAAFLSEGSISLPGLPEVAPPPHLTARTVAAALVQASQQAGAGRTAHCQAQFLSIAHEVSQGTLTWKQS